MAHSRQRSSTNANDPHAVSLKVLRLSKPSLATQTALPRTTFGNGLDITGSASLAFPSADVDSPFPLSGLLMLPRAFGAAYVGETFGCTLCVNNELLGGERKTVEEVQVEARLQTPSRPEGVELELAQNPNDGDGLVAAGSTMQMVVRQELKEEGAHVLAVTVTYTETLVGAVGAQRKRTFRKLYQFTAQQLIAVRSKVTESKRRARDERRRWILEAQLENVGETSVVLENITLNAQDGFECEDVNGRDGGNKQGGTVLKPQDVEQVMFVINEREEKAGGDVGDRVQLAQLVVGWRGAMGETGGLTTGWLLARPKG